MVSVHRYAQMSHAHHSAVPGTQTWSLIAWPLVVFFVLLLQSASGTLLEDCAGSGLERYQAIFELCEGCLSRVGVCSPQCCYVESPVGGQITLCVRGGCCVRRVGSAKKGYGILEGLRYESGGQGSGPCETRKIKEDITTCQPCGMAFVDGKKKTCSDGVNVPSRREAFFGSPMCWEPSPEPSEPESQRGIEGDEDDSSLSASEEPDTTGGADERPLRSFPPESIEDADVADSTSRTCFPASATVKTRDGKVMRMDQLETGEFVQVTPFDEYSEVFMFTHKVSNVKSKFIVLTLQGDHTLTLSPGHFVYTYSADVCSPSGADAASTCSAQSNLQLRKRSLQPAQSVVVGDGVMFETGHVLRIQSVATVTDYGLYNPHTLHGDIMVDGVLASTYTTAVAPSVAHAVLAPMRALYQLFGFVCCALERRDPFRVVSWLQPALV